MPLDESVPFGQQTVAAGPHHAFGKPRTMVQLLGINVRHLRHQKGISQEALADKTGIFRTYLSRIETGRSNPTLAVLDALAGALDVLPHSLLLPME